MSTDVRQAASVDRTSVPSRTHRRRAWFLLAFAAWNVWVWATRLVNLLGDGQDHSAAFIAVHIVLYAGGFGGAAVLTVMGVRMLREARAGGSPGEVDTP
jgi:hypothetical protein